MHHFLVTNFHIRKIGARPGWIIETISHKNDILVIINDYFLEMGGVMSHRTTHTFEIYIIMRSFYK